MKSLDGKVIALEFVQTPCHSGFTMLILQVPIVRFTRNCHTREPLLQKRAAPKQCLLLKRSNPNKDIITYTCRAVSMIAQLAATNNTSQSMLMPAAYQVSKLCRQIQLVNFCHKFGLLPIQIH